LDADGHALFRNGDRVALTPKALDVFIALATPQGNAVAKDDLLRAVWPATTRGDTSVRETLACAINNKSLTGQVWSVERDDRLPEMRLST